MRFARAVESPGDASLRASPGDALTFDVRARETADEESLAEARVAALDHAAHLLGATHLVAALCLMSLQPQGPLHLGFTNPMMPLSLLLLLDLAAAMALRWRVSLNLAPHKVVYGLAIYLVVSGALWILTGAAATAQASGPGVPALMMGGGAVMAAIVAVNSPPLALINAAISAAGAFLLTGSALLTGGTALLAVLIVAYSVAAAQADIAAARRRINLDAEARKALTFVDEFEKSGRGWFWETNAEGTLSYVSEQLAEDFECEPQALLGRQFTTLLSVQAGDALGSEPKTLGFHLSARFPFADVVVRAASDKDVHWSLSGNPVFDERGRFLGFRGIGTDLTEQRRSEQEISRLARFDSLTGLPNRARMRQTLDEALRNAASRQKGCALFLIDLDRFKNVNDTLGHPVGDALLRQVAERLKLVMGEHGQVGRLGGDEFKAVLPGIVDLGLLESLARTLIEQVSRPYMIEGHRVTIGASVGIAIGDHGRACADSLIRNADLALYAAKAAGRGTHCFYEPSMHSELTDRQVLENDLRQAIDRGELWVAFQPIVQAASEEISGFEALVRWSHPLRGNIPPDKFIPLAEECGLISGIGKWVLQNALAEAARWPDHVRVAVNLSPIQFNDPLFVQALALLLQEADVRADKLELEITEGVFLADGDGTDETFAKLKALGVRLALDDFGTGYSSLGYLKKAPFDKIKIDRSFVRGAASTVSRNGAIIRAIVTLADTLDMETCAEGVETHDDLELIRELGVSHVQGYIFGRPAPAEETRELADKTTVVADGYQCIREPRHRLMRRAITSLAGETLEIRLRNISSKGALVECERAVTPGDTLAIDIVGVGPVQGTVRWAQAGKFGVQFDRDFDLARLKPKKARQHQVTMMRPWYVERKAS
ncbi:MAG TPA: EAL domain-containing protein [Sphingomicrobium sp.]|nr:EAL domain-containing protein [Sphingomicrobium sp.]